MLDNSRPKYYLRDEELKPEIGHFLDSLLHIPWVFRIWRLSSPEQILVSSKLLTQHALSLIDLCKQQYHLYCFDMFC